MGYVPYLICLKRNNFYEKALRNFYSPYSFISFARFLPKLRYP